MVAKSTTTAPAGDSGRLARARADVSERRFRGPSIFTFFQESRSELRKVTWPTRQEAVNLTTAVIGMTIAVAAFLGAIDAGLDKLVAWMLGTG